MGSDLYSVAMSRYREWDRETAKRRLLLYGTPISEVEAFFAQRPEETWVEAAFFVDTIHPDCIAGWDPAFVIRVFDEGVMAGSWKLADKDFKKPYDYNDTPLVKHYGGWDSMWGMDFRMTDEKPSLTFVAEAQHFPGLKRHKWDGGIDDSSAYVAFIPKEYVPLLGTVTSWPSRAWQGTDYYRASLWPTYRAPRRIETSFLPPVSALDTSSLGASPPWSSQGTRLFPHPVNGVLLFLPSQGLFHLVSSPQPFANEKGGGSLRPFSSEPRLKTALAAVSTAPTSDGLLWFATASEVFALSVFDGSLQDNPPLPSLYRDKILGLDVSLDAPLLRTKKAIYLLHEGSFQAIYQGPSKACKGTQAGDIWIQKSYSRLLRRSASGDVEEFQAGGLGYNAFRSVHELPGGGLWFGGHSLVEWRSGHRRLLTSETLQHTLGTAGCESFASESDGTLWAIHARTRTLVVLKEGENPRSYVFPLGHPLAKTPYSLREIVIAPEGCLFFLTSEGIFFLPLSEVPHKQGQPADNADFFEDKPLAPWAYRRLPSAQALSMRLQGKKVAITGVFAAFTRPELQDRLQQLGAIVASSVSRKTDVLIAGQDAGQDLIKAQDLSIPVLSEVDFLAVWQNKDAPPPPPSPEAAIPTKVDPKVKKAFPLSDVAFTPHTVDHAFLRRMIDGSEDEISPEAWQELLQKHRDFLATEGSDTGSWQILTAAGLPITLYTGASTTEGQLSLARKRLSPSVVLQEAALSYADLTASVFEGRDLSKAVLFKAMATDSFFRGASFEGADLSFCDFSRSDLRGCVFRGARLEGTDFEKADLRGADFSETDVSSARFPGASLAGVVWSKPKAPRKSKKPTAAKKPKYPA